MNPLFDFAQLRQAAAVPLDNLASYEAVYFLGNHTQLFRQRCTAVALGLPRFAGVMVFEETEAKRRSVGQMLALERPWRLLTTAALLALSAADKAKLLVIDFNDTLAGKRIASELAAAGVTVRDCLYAMHELGLAHTYVSVCEERTHAIAHLDQYENMAPLFTDDCSRRTLLARLQALITLERSALIEVSFPLCDFINGFAPTAGLVVRADEIFIDAGAAHGDTVSHFYHASRGSFRAMHAFEPDAANFGALSALCAFLPNTSAYFAGLGERAGTQEFFENTANPFGSNFRARPTGSDGTPTQMMAIDDVVDAATLIKIDVEGYEAAVIKGAARVIAGSRPNMTISAYHYPIDIAQIIEIVQAIHPYRHIALRHYSADLYDTQLIFSDTQCFD
ncbi:FkbM family methyltransferase [Massilia sp. PWRC2]|uniref:FkbM family methyltransferase n=1 Tax=Massilia sp. PWRC2 TaxID=2804626 RepID=UPI003CF07668